MAVKSTKTTKVSRPTKSTLKQSTKPVLRKADPIVSQINAKVKEYNKYNSVARSTPNDFVRKTNLAKMDKTRNDIKNLTKLKNKSK